MDAMYCSSGSLARATSSSLAAAALSRAAACEARAHEAALAGNAYLAADELADAALHIADAAKHAWRVMGRPCVVAQEPHRLVIEVEIETDHDFAECRFVWLEQRDGSDLFLDFEVHGARNAYSAKRWCEENASELARGAL